MRQSAGSDRVLHRLGHPYRILGTGNRRCQQHRVTTKLHGEGRLRGGTDASIKDDRHRGMFDDQLDVVRIADAQPEPIGAPSGMTAAQPALASFRAKTGSSLV